MPYLLPALLAFLLLPLPALAQDFPGALPPAGTLVTPSGIDGLPEVGAGPTTMIPDGFWSDDDVSAPQDPLGDLNRGQSLPARSGEGTGERKSVLEGLALEPMEGDGGEFMPRRYMEKEGEEKEKRKRESPGGALVFVAGREGLEASILTLHRNGRFELHWSEVQGCTRHRDVREGRCRIRDGKVYLFPEGTTQALLKRNACTILEEIRWDGRSYLVPLAGEETFCNAVNEGSEPRNTSWGETFLHWEDWTKPARGKPRVPDWCASWLVDAPLEGTIRGLSENDAEVAELWDRGRARIDLGRQHGLRIGMRLYPPVPHAHLVVVALRQRQALAEVFGPASQGPWDPEETGLIRVGQAVSTRRPTLQNASW